MHALGAAQPHRPHRLEAEAVPDEAVPSEDGQLHAERCLLRCRAAGAARAWRRAAGLAANGSAAKHLLPRSASAAELLAEAVVALRKKRNRDEISEAELTDAVRDLERVFELTGVLEPIETERPNRLELSIPRAGRRIGPHDE